MIFLVALLSELVSHSSLLVEWKVRSERRSGILREASAREQHISRLSGQARSELRNANAVIGSSNTDDVSI